MGKIVGGVLAVIVLILGAIVAFLYFNLDKIIISAVEEYGSEVTRTDVTLNEVDLDLTSGAGALRGLSVGNPDGFEEPTAFELGAISVSVDMGGTSDKLIHIREIVVDAPKVTYELNQTTNNLDTIKNNVDSFMKANASSSGTESSDSADGGEGPKLIIDSLVIQNGRVGVKAPITLNKKIEGNLPTIRMKDIGKKENGATPEEVAAQIMDKLTSSSMNVVQGLGVGKTLDSLKQGLGGAGKAITEGAGGAGKALEGAAGGAGDALKGATEGVKGLFK
ncbi:hypothetical protein [Sneathiella chinensis]|uniref:AsmA domain-containing protein n=1 Tax=Sneathiella chinensis TaxID=349750 RepID=A0ABQ5U5H9_9PROT|nr:hypothetical protein [Sneathiella chinensis]GLQ05741.1 hypothetical protein GCM10007924_09620 [Sneathiella chinensis]